MYLMILFLIEQALAIPILAKVFFCFFFSAFAFVRGLLLLLVVLQYSGEALFQGAVAMYPPRHVLK